MAVIRVKDFDSFETAMKRFKKVVQDSGILTEMRRREHYEKPSVRRKKKDMIAARKSKARSSMLSRYGEALLNHFADILA